MIVVHGIRNCDSCRKALSWLGSEGIAHRFHDFRRDGLRETDLAHWIEQAGWESLLNRRGTTWRKLDESDRNDVDEDKAKALMTENPTLIKRPVIVKDETVLVGFNDRVRDALGH